MRLLYVDNFGLEVVCISKDATQFFEEGSIGGKAELEQISEGGVEGRDLGGTGQEGRVYEEGEGG